MACKCSLVLFVCFLFITPTDTWFFKTFGKLGRNVSKGVRNIGKGLGRRICKGLFGIVCPAAVFVGSAYIGGGTPARITSASSGGHMCRVMRSKCKREATMKMLAFSDNFTDYDSNENKVISYEEFVYSVMRSVDLADASGLEQPFFFADNNEDGHLDIDEFQAAPFLFTKVSPSNSDFHQHTTERKDTTTHDMTMTPSTA